LPKSPRISVGLVLETTTTVAEEVLAASNTTRLPVVDGAPGERGDPDGG
jgi:hypothetical protein